MAISQKVYIPSRPAERREEKKDPLDIVLKGLQVAQSVFGIKSGLEQSDLRALQTKAAEQQIARGERAQKQEEFVARGGLTPKDIKSVSFVEEGTKGARPGFLKTPEGQEKDVFYLTENDIKLSLEEQLRNNKKIQDKIDKDISIKDTKNDRTLKFAENYRKATKSLLESIDGLDKMEALYTAKNPTGASDIALIFSFMKSIDPESVVREGEFATAAKSQGLVNWAKSQIDKVQNGMLLAPQARRNFMEAARRSVLKRLDVQKSEDVRFGELADVFGADKSLIFSPILEETYDRLSKLPEIRQGIIKDDNRYMSEQKGNLIPQKIGDYSIIPKAQASDESDDDFINNYLRDESFRRERAVPPGSGSGIIPRANTGRQ